MAAGKQGNRKTIQIGMILSHWIFNPCVLWVQKSIQSRRNIIHLQKEYLYTLPPIQYVIVRERGKSISRRFGYKIISLFYANIFFFLYLFSILWHNQCVNYEIARVDVCVQLEEIYSRQSGDNMSMRIGQLNVCTDGRKEKPTNMIPVWLSLLLRHGNYITTNRDVIFLFQTYFIVFKPWWTEIQNIMIHLSVQIDRYVMRLISPQAGRD